jgi:thiamine biosynthesis protein ThiC
MVNAVQQFLLAVNANVGRLLKSSELELETNKVEMAGGFYIV